MLTDRPSPRARPAHRLCSTLGQVGRVELLRATTIPDRASLLRIAAAMLDGDDARSGATLIMPDGMVTFIDAQTLKRGGSA